MQSQHKLKDTQNQLQTLKLEFLKKFLGDNGIENVESANSVGEVWALLFKHDAFYLYYDLVSAGISPTSDELNQFCGAENVNAWYWLAGPNDDRNAIFKALLDKGIYPNANALSVCHSTYNVNAWYGLSCSDDRAVIFKALLDKGICPDANALSVCHSTYNVNAWYELSTSDNRSKIFKALLDKGIWPDANTLSVFHSTYNSSTWYGLSFSERRGVVFKALLDKDIWPDAHALLVCHSTYNDNTWYGLSRSDSRGVIFKALLDKNIWPDANALSVCYSTYNHNTWYGLSHSDSRCVIFKALLDKGIWPDAKALSVCHSTYNDNTWYNLSCSNSRSKIFEYLVDKDILPTPDVLSKTYGNKNENITSKLTSTLIINRLNHLNELEKNYNLDKSDQITILLSRNNAREFYGFLYLFYLDFAKTNSRIPIEIWNLIGKYILPPSVSDVKTLASEENQSGFVKHYMIDSLSQYSSSYFVSHGERAESLKTAAKRTSDSSSVLINQCLMAYRENKTPYKNTPKKYQQPYSKVAKEEILDTLSPILREGFFLNVKKSPLNYEEKPVSALSCKK